MDVTQLRAEVPAVDWKQWGDNLVPRSRRLDDRLVPLIIADLRCYEKTGSGAIEYLMEQGIITPEDLYPVNSPHNTTDEPSSDDDDDDNAV